MFQTLYALAQRVKLHGKVGSPVFGTQPHKKASGDVLDKIVTPESVAK